MGGVGIGGMYAPVLEDQAVATVEAAWDAGIRFFDTAPVYGYGNAERYLGQVLARKPRDEYVLATKVGRLLLHEGPEERRDALVYYGGSPLFKGTPDVEPYYLFTYDGVMRSFEESLTRLGVDRVDILHIHDPDDYVDEALTGAYVALDRLREEGVVGAIGVGTNNVAPLLRFAREADPDCFLVAGRYTLLDQSALGELLPLCQERGIALVIGGVYNSGILCNLEPRRATATARDPADIPTWVAGATFNYLPATAEWIARAQRLKEVCDRHDTPLMAAAIQFPLAHPAVATILMGPRSVDEVEENERLFRFDVPSDLWEELYAEGLLPTEAPVPGAAQTPDIPSA